MRAAADKEAATAGVAECGGPLALRDGEADGAAQLAMTALARGAGLVIAITLEGSLRHRFLEDLHKVAAPIPYEPPASTTGAALGPTHAQLLDALARGATVTAEPALSVTAECFNNPVRVNYANALIRLIGKDDFVNRVHDN